MARPLAAAAVAALLTVSGAAGWPAQTPKRGGTVGVVYGIEPPCLNVLVSPCRDGILPVSSVLLGAFDNPPDYSWRPRLVSRVDFTTRPPFTLTYHIRPEARWSDGVPITSRDFVFTYRAKLAYPEQTAGDFYKTQIRGVRALDAKTVRVVLRGRSAYWHSFFSVVLPEHALRGENLGEIWNDRIDNPKTGAPIGSGPFLLERWERGKQLTLRRNPRYWGHHPAYVDRIVVRFSFDPSEIADLFRTGAADVGQWQFTPDIASALRQAPGVALRFTPDAPGWEHFDIRTRARGHPALRNKLVRRALAYGINRVAIVSSLFGEAGPAVKPLDSLVFRSRSSAYEPDWSRYRYRPAEARRLLEQAGCRRGADGIYSCVGERLSLRFVSRGNVDRRVQTLALAQAELRQAGIEVVPEYAPSLVHDQILQSGDFDVTLFAWFDNTPERPGAKDIFGCGGGLNYTGYCQRLVTRDLDQADRILDAGRRAQVLNRADAQMARDVPVIPLFELPAVAGVRSTVHGYSLNFFDPTWNAENWWLDR